MVVATGILSRCSLRLPAAAMRYRVAFRSRQEGAARTRFHNLVSRLGLQPISLAGDAAATARWQARPRRREWIIRAPIPRGSGIRRLPGGGAGVPMALRAGRAAGFGAECRGRSARRTLLRKALLFCRRAASACSSRRPAHLSWPPSSCRRHRPSRSDGGETGVVPFDRLTGCP